MKNKLKLFISLIIVLLIFTSCNKTISETEITISTSVKDEYSYVNNEEHVENTTSTEKPEVSTSLTTKIEVDIDKSVKPSENGITQSTAATTEKYITCTLEIDCSTAVNNIDNLKKSKVEFVPENGKILNKKVVIIPQGSTAFDLIKQACKENVCEINCSFCAANGIHIDYSYTPAYDNYYIRGVHQLYEKDCGTKSGWMYQVNGIFLNCGTSSYVLKDGDSVKLLYTCDLGEDLY